MVWQLACVYALPCTLTKITKLVGTWMMDFCVQSLNGGQIFVLSGIRMVVKCYTIDPTQQLAVVMKGKIWIPGKSSGIPWTTAALKEVGNGPWNGPVFEWFDSEYKFGALSFKSRTRSLNLSLTLNCNGNGDEGKDLKMDNLSCTMIGTTRSLNFGLGVQNAVGIQMLDSPASEYKWTEPGLFSRLYPKLQW